MNTPTYLERELISLIGKPISLFFPSGDRAFGILRTVRREGSQTVVSLDNDYGFSFIITPGVMITTLASAFTPPVRYDHISEWHHLLACLECGAAIYAPLKDLHSRLCPKRPISPRPLREVLTGTPPSDLPEPPA
jgi:hypothetical protein